MFLYMSNDNPKLKSRIQFYGITKNTYIGITITKKLRPEL